MFSSSSSSKVSAKEPQHLQKQSNGIPTVPSFSYNAWNRLRTVCKALRRAEGELETLKGDIERRMQLCERERTRNSDLESRQIGLLDFEHQVEMRRAKVITLNARMASIRNDQEQKANELNVFEDTIRRTKEDVVDKQNGYIQQRERLVRCGAQLAHRRRQLIEEFSTVYDIRPGVMSIDASQGASTAVVQSPATVPCACKQPWTISGAHLPNGDAIGGHSELELSVGLGQMAHALSVLSRLVDVPLRYPLFHLASRSAVEDPLSVRLSDGDRVCPLFSKGQNRYLFEYGVYLLNKNIVQLRADCLLATAAMTPTLENFASLLKHLCTARTSIPISVSRPLPTLSLLNRTSSSNRSSRSPRGTPPLTNDGSNYAGAIAISNTSMKSTKMKPPQHAVVTKKKEVDERDRRMQVVRLPYDLQ